MVGSLGGPIGTTREYTTAGQRLKAASGHIIRAVPRAQLFVTCIVDALYPPVGEAMAAVLERLGVALEFPATQTCCGQPAFNAGFRAEARALALKWLDDFELKSDLHPPAPSPQRGEGESEYQLPDIVSPSGSCAAMVRHGFPELLRDDPANLARARALAARMYEFSQYLVEVLKVEDVGARFEGKLTYHPACHLTRGLGVTEAPLKLLRHVRGAEVTPLPQAEECCGFGGLFAVKHGDLSGAMLDKKLEAIRQSGAAAVVGCDLSCLMHLQGGLNRDDSPVRCLHLAEVLAGRNP